MKDEAFYAGIHEPKEVRRDLLLSQKDIVDCLKRFEHIKNIRTEKDLRLVELRKLLSALKLIAHKLKSMMPAHAIKTKVQREEQHESMPISRPAKKEAQQRKTKIQVLEDELAKIEGKLGSLE